MMNSKIERSVVSALCVGIIFCLATVAALAQSGPACPNAITQVSQAAPAPPCPGGNCPAQNCLSGNCQAQACANAPCLSGCSKVKDAQKASAEAAEVFRKIAVLKDKVPDDILCKAVAIGAFSGVFNLAFTFGYRQGDGAITVRTPNGWSAPVFYKMKGGSFGWQIGATSTDYLLIFMSQESIRDLSDGEFDMALDAHAVIGPVFGGRLSAGTHDFPKSKTVFVYARSKGVFAGAIIDGAKLMARNRLNNEIYGADARELLTNPDRLQTVALTCVPPGLTDLSHTVAANVPNPQPIIQRVICQPTPQPQPPAPTAEATPAPAEQPTPKRVINVTEEETVIIEEQPQKPMPRASRRRAHKMKR